MGAHLPLSSDYILTSHYSVHSYRLSGLKEFPVSVPVCLSYESRVACGDQAARRRHAPGWGANALFFLEVFGFAVVVMGSAMVLTAVSQVRETTPTVSQIAQGYDDTYLESFAKGPGRDWYVPGHVPCAADRACAQP